MFLTTFTKRTITLNKLIGLLALAFVASATQAQEVESVYTNLSPSKCQTIEIDEESGSSVQNCPGVGGYRLLVLDDDSRQSITVTDSAGKKYELNLWHVITGAFSSVGQKAEWRVTRKEGKPIPFALIVRVNASEDVEKPNRITSYLSVTKITANSVCVTHKIGPGAKANEEARKAADESATAPCLKEIGP